MEGQKMFSITMGLGKSKGAIAIAGCALALLSLSASASDITAGAAVGDLREGTPVENRLVRREIVQVSDLNLASPEGMKTLHDRIAKAVDSVCGGWNSRERFLARGGVECRANAQEAATAQVEALTVRQRMAQTIKCEDAAHANVVSQLQPQRRD
jgi:UrcA family protein